MPLHAISPADNVNGGSTFFLRHDQSMMRWRGEFSACKTTVYLKERVYNTNFWGLPILPNRKPCPLTTNDGNG